MQRQFLTVRIGVLSAQIGSNSTAVFMLFRDRLPAELSHAVKNTHDHHWEEIAHWLVYEAKLG
jgi:hypothetical protein